MNVDSVSLQTEQASQPVGFTAKEKRDELMRQVQLMKVSHPAMIRSGRLSFQQSEKIIGIMNAIFMDYDKQYRADRKAPKEEEQQADVSPVDSQPVDKPIIDKESTPVEPIETVSPEK